MWYITIMSALQEVRMRVFSDTPEACQFTANLLLERIAGQPAISLLVPTGTSPEGIYELLRQQPAETFQGVSFFNFDEYCTQEAGRFRLIDPGDPQSYRRYMQERVLRSLPTIQNHFPGIENNRYPGRYDQLIRSLGGIQLALNGLGENGHIFGFNEPLSSRGSVTRLVALSESTIKTNEALTQGPVKKYAVTTGIATGMAADEVITLAFGERKAKAVKRAMRDEISSFFPATYLREHPNHLWVVDEAAASQL